MCLTLVRVCLAIVRVYPKLTRVCLTLIPGVFNTRLGVTNTPPDDQAPEIPDLVEVEPEKGRGVFNTRVCLTFIRVCLAIARVYRKLA